MAAQNRLTLWRLTWSHCSGVYWLAMRLCDADAAREWLQIFQNDEPGATFHLSARRPQLPDNAREIARHPAVFR